LEPRTDRFGTLVNSIISQQISSKAAESIGRRLIAIGGEPHHPQRLIALGETTLRSVGLSAAKARYVLNLAEAVHSGSVPLDAIDDSWEDARIIQALTTIKGIGVWTAEMFLIFALNRPDVLPIGEMGVRVGIKNRHGLTELPVRTQESCNDQAS
jgi:DNA-3-methyladenine glycosylase II